jgi:short-subunit dehydrogenase
MTTALVTGATSGLGAEFARQLAARGYDLVLVARSAERLAELADELGSANGTSVDVMVADLGNREDLERVSERLSSADRPIDMLVNNAGFGVTAELLDPDWSIHKQALDVMGLAVLVLGGAAGRAMRERGRGVILNVSSLSAWISQGGYSPVKAYAKSYSEGLANELHGTGVTVTALCPGWVRTEFHERAGIKTGGIPEFIWVDAERCVREALAHADAGKVISLPTKRWKLAAFGLSILPGPAVRKLSRMLTGSRR